MRFYYEYKYKTGCLVRGHNLEEIENNEEYIILKGVDIIPTINDFEERHWSVLLSPDDIEYLKIEPMLEKESE